MTNPDKTVEQFNPVCGSGGFLARVADIYYTPSQVIAHVQGRTVDDYHHLIANPPYGLESDGKTPQLGQ
jgi:hypothetical protein